MRHSTRCKIEMMTAILLIYAYAVCATPLAFAEENGQSAPRYSVGLSGGSGSGGTGTAMPDLSTGTLSYAIPIEVPAGRNGMDPQLSLIYKSSNGDGLLGMGWELEAGSIERNTKKGVTYTESDGYILRISGAALELYNLPGTNDYQAKVEGLFLRIRKIANPDGSPIYWEVTDKSGMRFLYGQTSASRQDDPANSSHVFKWCLDRVEDPFGNYMLVSYDKKPPQGLGDYQGQIYLDRIDYAGNSSGLSTTNYVKFYLETRTDAPEMYTANFKIKTAFRLRTIGVFSNGVLTRAYKLAYASSSTGRSLLAAVQQYGKNAAVSDSGAVTGGTALPGPEMVYSSETRSFDDQTTWIQMGDGDPGRYGYGDFNGDGRMDIVHVGTEGNLYVALSRGDDFAATNGEKSWINWTAFKWLQMGNGDPGRYTYGDFNGDGKTDVLHIGVEGNLYVALSRGSDFAAVGGETNWSNVTAFKWIQMGDGNPGRYFFGDFNGDGKTEVLHIGIEGNLYAALSRGNDFAAANGETNWANMTAFKWIQMGDGNPGRYNYGDFNGDGKTDVLHIGIEGNLYVALSRGNDFAAANGETNWTNITAFKWIQMGDGNPGRYSYRDFNGDGKTDVLHVGIEGNLYAALSRGADFAAVGGETNWTNMTAFKWIQMGDGNPGRYSYRDFNGDGRTDVLHVGVEGNLYVALSRGNDFAAANGETSWSNMAAFIWLQLGNGEPSRYSYDDFSGDGRIDVLHLGLEGNKYVSPAAGDAPNLCRQISNGIGGMTKIEYAPSTRYGTNPLLPFPVNTVNRVTADDGRGSVSETNFSYSGGFYHIADRDFRGFHRVMVAGPLGPDGEQSVSETWFHQGKDVAVGANDPFAADGYMKGKAYRVQIRDGQGRLMSEMTTAYDEDNSPPYFNPAKEIIATTYDGDASSRQTKTVYTYGDAYGNVTREDQYGDINDNADDRVVVREFVPNPDAWILGLPSKETIYSGLVVTQKMAETIYYYDGVPESDCTTASTIQMPTKGKVTRIVRLHEEKSAGGQDPEVLMAYDAYGNLACAKDALGRISTVTYDGTHTYPTVAKNPLNHQTTTRYYGVDGIAADKGLSGQVKSVTDPNGAVTTTEYDVFGRITKTTLPDASWSSRTYNDFGNIAAQHVKSDTSVGLSIWTYFDGLGRTYLSKKTGPDSKIIATETLFNATGSTRQATLPYFEGLENPRWTINHYDSLGRILRTDYPDNTNTKVCYNDGVVMGIDANGHGKRETRDVYGRLVRVDEYLGTFGDCTTEQGAPYATTNYAYDVLGRLRYVTDAQSAVTEMQYDSLGRKIVMIDPDMGRWEYAYDANGNLTSQKDAKNQTVSFLYDSLNRLTNKNYPTGVNSVYTYDTLPSTNYIGRLTKVTDAAGQTAYYYDKMGRVLKTVKTISAKNYTTESTYDGLGRIKTVKYPESVPTPETVTYTYNAGVLSTVAGGGTTYASYGNHNALGQPGTVSYGNGVTTTYQYHTQNNRLQSITTGKTAPLLSLTYGYDNAGNVTGIADGIDYNRTQTFLYDDLDRLQQAQSAGYGVLWYNYDQTGNILMKEGVTYSYDSADKPHAVRSTTDGKTYNYDANGNMLTDGTRVIAYDYDNMPKMISVGANATTYTYDAGGSRVKKTTTTGTNVYIGKLYECKGTACTKYIFAGDTLIAQKSGSQVMYFTQDHLGSSRIVTDGSGNEIEDVYYAPFGGSQSDTGSISVTHKYTSQEYDTETGLYYYNARYYNPALGRFVSPDTIVPNPANPQAFNRYSYVLNNPLRYTDPSGNCPWCIGAVVGAVVGAASAGYYTNWNLKAMATGAVIGAAAGATGNVAGAWAYGAAGGGATGAVVGGVVGGAAGGAAGGATATAFYGGNLGQNVGTGAAYGAIGGGVTGGLMYAGVPGTVAAAGGGYASGYAQCGGRCGEQGAMWAFGGQVLNNVLVMTNAFGTRETVPYRLKEGEYGPNRLTLMQSKSDTYVATPGSVDPDDPLWILVALMGNGYSHTGHTQDTRYIAQGHAMTPVQSNIPYPGESYLDTLSVNTLTTNNCTTRLGLGFNNPNQYYVNYNYAGQGAYWWWGR